MATLLITVSFVFLVMETFIGLVANGSIVLINFIDWFRKRKLSPADQILICLSLSRLLLQALLILDVILFIFLNNTSSNLLVILMGLWAFISTVNILLAACLSVFYLAKIAIFSHPVFLQVKGQFPGLVPWLLLGSVVFSAVLTIIIIITSWTYYDLSICNPYKSLSSNSSNAEMHMPNICWYIFVLMIAFDLLPFIVFFSSSIFLISSLWKHMRCVQCNGTGCRDLNTQAHLRAIKALASFAVLYLINIAAVTTESIVAWNKQHTWTTVLSNVSALYPTGHAIILILINPKLKEAWVRMIHHLKCGSRCKISGNFKLAPEKSGEEMKMGNFGEILGETSKQARNP